MEQSLPLPHIYYTIGLIARILLFLLLCCRECMTIFLDDI